VTTYSLTKYAPEMLISIVAIMVFGITPGLGGIIGVGNLTRASGVRAEIMALTWLVVTVLGATILLWNRAFIGLWVGANQYAGTVPGLLVVVVVTQFVWIRNDASIIDLTLRLRPKVLIGFLSAALAIGAASVLVSYFRLGIVGVCLGLILGRSTLSVGYPVLVGRFLGISFTSQLKKVLRPAFVTFLLFSLASVLDAIASANFSFIRGWIDLILSVGVTCGVVLLLAFYTGLSSNQRRTILSRMRMVITTASG